MDNTIGELIERNAAQQLGFYDGGKHQTLDEPHYAVTPEQLRVFVGGVIDQLNATPAVAPVKFDQAELMRLVREFAEVCYGLRHTTDDVGQNLINYVKSLIATSGNQADNSAVPEGWNIQRADKGPFQTIVVQAPNGFTASVSKHERNPMNVLYMLADALLQSKT